MTAQHTLHALIANTDRAVASLVVGHLVIWNDKVYRVDKIGWNRACGWYEVTLVNAEETIEDMWYADARRTCIYAVSGPTQW